MSEEKSDILSEKAAGPPSGVSLVVTIVAAGASGGLMAACYWPLEWHFVAWIALVPWLVVMHRLDADRTWLYGTIVGLVFYRIGLGWLFKLHGPLGGLAVVGFSLLMGFSFRVARLLMDRLGTGAILWAVPLAFVGQEVLRCEGLPRHRFAYLGWGYSQSHNVWVAQIASIGGVYFVSFLVVAVNAAIAYALVHRRRGSWVPALATVGAVLVLGAVSQPGSYGSGEGIPVACVQGEDLRYERFLELTNEAANDPTRPRYIVLPEHTVQEVGGEKHTFIKQLAALARRRKVFICLGAHLRAPAGSTCDYDNVGLLIGADGTIAGQQAKSVPVPFFDDGNPAKSLATFATPDGRAGIYVCYDATFTDIPRRLVDLGAEFLLAPLMDPERWPVRQRWLHADMAPLRSIELRRCAVRSASSGISQIIDATGRVCVQRTKEEGPGVLVGRIERVDERTVFVRGGYLFATLVGVAFLILVAWLTVGEWLAKIRARSGSR
ncbi:MAG: hypothetical protein JXQ73_27205 [Phycisphaerae bacterium]|nr:hypothetical protein [Phycisphaerae bacterium]